MRLYVDLETLQLIEGPGFRNPVTSMRFKRGDTAQLDVVFLENGTTAAEIGDPGTLELQFGIKPRGRYDVDYLVHEDQWTLPAPGAQDPVYQCAPSFNTAELDSAMQVGSSAGSELAEIALMGEITWREGTGDPTSTRTFSVVVENDVNRGTEAAPTELATPDDWLDDRAVRYNAAQTPLDAGQRDQFYSNFGAELPEYFSGYALTCLELLDEVGYSWLRFDSIQGEAIMDVVLRGYHFIGQALDDTSLYEAINLDYRYLLDYFGSYALDWSGSEIFTYKDMVGGSYAFVSDAFAYYNGGSYLYGATGSFQSSDGYTVTVNGGIITDIS